MIKERAEPAQPAHHQKTELAPHQIGRASHRHSHRRRLWLSLSLVALLLASLLFSASAPRTLAVGPGIVSTATREGRLAVFDDVWTTIRELYYDPSFNGLDWEAERATFRPLAAEATNAAELYTILRRMIGRLQDAHTRLRTPDEKFDWRHPRVISVGLSVREVEGQPVVVSIEQDSAAERLGLRPGDLITTIDAEPALDLFRRRLSEQGGSSTIAAARLRAMATLFDGPRDSTVNLTWRDRAGREHGGTLRREMHQRSTALVVRSIGSGNVLVAFDTFAPETALEFNRAVTGRLRTARGIILDLRNNGGGDAEAMTEMASTFLPAGQSLGRFTGRNSSTTFEPQTRSAMLFFADPLTRLRAPVVILSSERTSSAAEIFSNALRESGRARLVGQNTCGCVLAIRRRHTLPDGGELDVSEMDYRTARGLRLEGVGLAPDDVVPLRRADLLARRDRSLERALVYLSTQQRSR